MSFKYMVLINVYMHVALQNDNAGQPMPLKVLWSIGPPRPRRRKQEDGKDCLIVFSINSEYSSICLASGQGTCMAI